MINKETITLYNEWLELNSQMFESFLNADIELLELERKRKS